MSEILMGFPVVTDVVMDIMEAMPPLTSPLVQYV